MLEWFSNIGIGQPHIMCFVHHHHIMSTDAQSDSATIPVAETFLAVRASSPLGDPYWRHNPRMSISPAYTQCCHEFPFGSSASFFIPKKVRLRHSVTNSPPCLSWSRGEAEDLPVCLRQDWTLQRHQASVSEGVAEAQSSFAHGINKSQ